MEPGEKERKKRAGPPWLKVIQVELLKPSHERDLHSTD